MYALLFCSLLCGQAEAPRPVAVVLQTQGEVILERTRTFSVMGFGIPGLEKGRRLLKADLLLPGDCLKLAGDAEAVLAFLADSHRERLKGGSQAIVDRAGCNADRIEATMNLSSRNLKKVREVFDGSGGVGVVRGDKSRTEARVTPLFGAFVLTDRPALTWPKEPQAQTYLVELFDASEKRVWGVETKDPRLPFPEKEKALEPSLLYTWSVTAQLPEEATKSVVERSKLFLLLKGELEALEPVRKLAASKDPADLLLAAMAYESYKVHDEALKLFEKLAELQPDAVNYQLALSRYYTHAGREDLARQALAKAEKLGIPAKKGSE
jgi:tetratricopeptide (TPR) repeat protein